jgi:hypothetical protein
MGTNTLEIIPSSNMYGIMGIVKYHFFNLFIYEHATSQNWVILSSHELFTRLVKCFKL